MIDMADFVAVPREVAQRIGELAAEAVGDERFMETSAVLAEIDALRSVPLPEPTQVPPAELEGHSQEEWLTAADAAVVTGRKARTIRKALLEGRLDGEQRGARDDWFVLRSVAEDYVRRKERHE